MDKLSPGLRDLLNRVVSDRIEDFVLETEESQLKGDNFLGEIAFLSLKNKETGDQLYFVVKRFLEAMKANQLLSKLYRNEICFYEKIWPALDEYQRAHAVGFDKIAKYYGHADKSLGDELVLEDLRKRQFRLYDKTIPLDDKHIRFIFENYAVFHAISFAFREQQPEEFLELTRGVPTVEERLPPESGIASMMKLHLEFVRNLFVGDEGVIEAINKHYADPMKHFVKETRYVGDTPVVTHGDCWSNNIMFKYNDVGEVVDLRFLDFQLMTVSSPAHDLSYALYSGASKETLDKLDDYLKLYHEKFTETLEKLECKPKRSYTLETLREEWRKYCTYGFYLGLQLWRMKLVDKNNIPKFSGTLNRDLPPIAKDKVDLYHKMIKGLVTHMYENGFL